MKIQRITLTVGLIVIGSTCVFLLSFLSHKSITSNSASQLDNSAASFQVSNSDATDTLKRRNDERILMAFNAVESSNQPVDFWGKIIDQNNNPVAGVRVVYSYITEHGTISDLSWGFERYHQSEIISDLAGEFYIGNFRARLLEIKSLAKSDYESTKRGVQNYDYYGSTSEGRFISNKDVPIVFFMIDKEAMKDVVTYGSALESGMQVVGDGVPVRWNVRSGKADSNGELQVTFKREPIFLSNSSERLQWSLKIELIGGGIIAASPADAIYRAPEIGYLSTIDYPKVEQKRGYPNQAFYFKAADNKYGRLHLELYAEDKGESARLYIQSWLNSSGGRLLEAGSNP
ncbi:MAG: hypothetical protein JWL59_4378 [Chthoniobacteraceae bacterium]|nr:hypothetical protein [Chthoniobacteraceae bacterium]